MPDIQSPCVRNCCLNEEDICLGCFRSLDEIIQWGSALEQQKRQILDRARQRKKHHQFDSTLYIQQEL